MPMTEASPGAAAAREAPSNRTKTTRLTGMTMPVEAEISRLGIGSTDSGGPRRPRKTGERDRSDSRQCHEMTSFTKQASKHNKQQQKNWLYHYHIFSMQRSFQQLGI
jgi:hypothetical protein